MTLSEDDDYNARFPKERLARVVITMTDGHRYTSETTAATWDPESPPSDDDLILKFHDFADPVMGRKKAEALVELVFGLDVHQPNASNAEVITDLISAPF